MRASLSLAALAAFLVISGCATTGEIPIDLSVADEIYISPANQDGIQDEVTLGLVVSPHDRTVIRGYAVTVTDAAGTVVSVSENAAEPPGFFRRLFGGDRTAAVDPPGAALWDGRDTSGAFVPDGVYTLTVGVVDSRGNTGVGPGQRIVVDNTPPSLDLSAPYLLFTPNGDDRVDVLPVYQRSSSTEDLWTGRFIDADGNTVRTFTWPGGARDFIWDGSTDSGRAAPAGAYTYEVSATDRAGNTAAFELPGIVLELDPGPASVSVNRRVFSPNNDGRADTIALVPLVERTDLLAEWRLEIRSALGESVRAFTGPTLPASIVFDGRAQNGRTIPDGEYRAALALGYAGGMRQEVVSPLFVSDTTPPQATVQVSRSVFAPTGESGGETVEIIQSSSLENLWVGTMANQAGQVVLSRSWSGRAESFVWNGTDADKNALPDGLYTYSLTATDEGENRSRPAGAQIRIDGRPAPVRVTASAPRLSPNDDGVHDTVTLALAVAVLDSISGWRVRILNAFAEPVGIIASGDAAPPESAVWDGRVNRAVVRDGEYLAEFSVSYARGDTVSARSTVLRVDTAAPVVTVTPRPAPFSPDGDGQDDELVITISARDPSPIDRWRAELHDSEGRLFMEWSGSGAPAPIRWSGVSHSGELVRSGEDYRLTVRVTDAVGNTGTGTAVVPVDILVFQEGDRLRIRVSSIYFVSYTADYINLEPAIARTNLATLDRLALVLRKYPHHSILVEGHAVREYWNDPMRALWEEREVLGPLSLDRARVIRQALITRGVDGARMSIVGIGGIMPVVPHSDLENRWQNRRVEFLLERR